MTRGHARPRYVWRPKRGLVKKKEKTTDDGMLSTVVDLRFPVARQPAVTFFTVFYYYYLVRVLCNRHDRVAGRSAETRDGVKKARA